MGPMKINTGIAFGYAQVNFVGPAEALKFKEHFEGFSQWQPRGTKAVVVEWSRRQGLALNVDRYCGSPLMHDDTPDECRPIVLQNGVRVQFPVPCVSDSQVPSTVGLSQT